VRPGQLTSKGGRPTALDGGERESVDLVLESYGGLSAHQLSQMTHTEAPWVRARIRAGAAPLQRSRERLADNDIFEYFDALTSIDADELED
jgi:uncharacterized phage-associated protein